MEKFSNRRIPIRNAMLMCVEALTTSVLILAIIALVAGRFPHSLQKSPILTFDTSSFKTQLAQKDTSNPGNVQDWYELHYLSVCKGMWQSAGTQVKDDASRICTTMGGGYNFSLPELLAADAGLPVDSPFLSTWSFAVLNTKAPFILLAIAIACTSLTMIIYFVVIVTTPELTLHIPLFWPRVGYLSSVAALNLLLISSSKITKMAHNLLKNKAVVENGLAFWTKGFYVLTWLASGLMIVVLILSIVLAFMMVEHGTKTLWAT